MNKLSFYDFFSQKSDEIEKLKELIESTKKSNTKFEREGSADKKFVKDFLTIIDTDSGNTNKDIYYNLLWFAITALICIVHLVEKGSEYFCLTCSIISIVGSIYCFLYVEFLKKVKKQIKFDALFIFIRHLISFVVLLLDGHKLLTIEYRPWRILINGANFIQLASFLGKIQKKFISIYYLMIPQMIVFWSCKEKNHICTNDFCDQTNEIAIFTHKECLYDLYFPLITYFLQSLLHLFYGYKINADIKGYITQILSSINSLSGLIFYLENHIKNVQYISIADKNDTKLEKKDLDIKKQKIDEKYDYPHRDMIHLSPPSNPANIVPKNKRNKVYYFNAFAEEKTWPLVESYEDLVGLCKTVLVSSSRFLTFYVDDKEINNCNYNIVLSTLDASHDFKKFIRNIFEMPESEQFLDQLLENFDNIEKKTNRLTVTIHDAILKNNNDMNKKENDSDNKINYSSSKKIQWSNKSEQFTKRNIIDLRTKSLQKLQIGFGLKDLSENTYETPKYSKEVHFEIRFSLFNEKVQIFEVRKHFSRKKNQDCCKGNIYTDQTLSQIIQDMRCPLNNSMGILQTALINYNNVPNKFDFQKLYDKLYGSMCFLEVLINDILDINRISKGIFKMEPKAFDLEQLCQECLNIVKNSSSKSKPFLKFELNFTAATKTIVSDPSRMKQVLQNLLTNAEKFTEKGLVKIEVQDHNEDILHVAISDTGKGIEENLINKLFSAYTSDRDNKNIKGIGLGLYTSKYLVQNLGPGYNINVKSKIGQGTQFDFEIYKIFDISKKKQNETNLGYEFYDKESKSMPRRKSLFQGNKNNSVMDNIFSYLTKKRSLSSYLRKSISNVSDNIKGTMINPQRINKKRESQSKELSRQDAKYMICENKKPKSHFRNYQSKFTNGEKNSDSKEKSLPDNNSDVIVNNEPVPELSPLSAQIYKTDIITGHESSKNLLNKSMKIFVLDDDKTCRSIIKVFLKNYFKDKQIAYEAIIFSTDKELLDYMKSYDIHNDANIIFLIDYYLENCVGVDVANSVMRIPHLNLDPSNFVLISGIEEDLPEINKIFLHRVNKPLKIIDFNTIMDKIV